MTRTMIVVGVAALALCACGAEPAEPAHTVTVRDASPEAGDVADDEVRTAAKTSLDSAMMLAHEAVSEGGNTVISPAALSYLLAIAREGSSCDAASEITDFIGGSGNTYRYLAAAAGSEDKGSSTRLTATVLHAADGQADADALQEAADRFAATLASVPGEEMTPVGDRWLNESTRGSASRLPVPLAANADAAILASAHYETAWAVDVAASTTRFDFVDGRTELVPSLEIGPANSWETESGLMIELPTVSADPTYILYPDVDVELSDLTADDWTISGDPEPVTITLPSLAISSSLDIDSQRRAAGLDGLAGGGECGLSGFGTGANIDFGSQYASYAITADGISLPDGTELPDVIAPSEPRPTSTVTINRPFALLTVDSDTGWAITYAMINDPTR